MIEKLKIVLNYQNDIIYMPLKLEADAPTIVNWWVNVLYALQPGMQIHTGGCV